MLTKLLPLDSANRRLFAVFLMLLAVSCIRPPYLDYFGMQHAPTVVAVVAILAAERSQLLDRTGFALVVAFLMLHTLGARYLYSYVPYDAWSQSLLGTNLTDYFGFKRNHYDRLVHFCFGLLLAYPLAQFFKLRLNAQYAWPAALSVCVIAAASAVYEIGEWLNRAFVCARLGGGLYRAARRSVGRTVRHGTGNHGRNYCLHSRQCT
jgi:putative membrane protein